jgi:hypothetical protein
MTIDVDGAVRPTLLRRCMLAVTTLTGILASVALAAIILTALFGGEGESALGLALFGAGAGAIILHAAALGQLLLRRRQGWLFRNGVLLGGIGLLAISGAAVVFAEFDDAPGGVLAGLLLAIQGGVAILTVAFPQLVPQRPSQA